MGGVGSGPAEIEHTVSLIFAGALPSFDTFAGVLALSDIPTEALRRARNRVEHMVIH